jgi:hypothetical protein
MVLETVQNGIDAEAKNIWVTVNHKTRRVVVCDDGEGATTEKFDQALGSIGKSIKRGDKLGQFGIGLISPLGKCEYFTFISTPKSDPHAFREWTFNSDMIKAQAEGVKIPSKMRSDLRFSRQGGKEGVNWRTQVDVHGFMKDRLLSRCTVQSIADAIRQRYSRAMHKVGTIVHVAITDSERKTSTADVHPILYTGTALELVSYRDPKCGKSEFKLFLANKTTSGRQGQVFVGQAGNSFRLPFKQFAKQLANVVDQEAMDALTSGIFEGDAVSDCLTLLPDRKRFVEDEGLLGFCLAIELWYKEHGSEHVLQIKEDNREERYQQLGERSMRVVESLLSSPQFNHLQEVVNGFKVGTIGSNHTQPDAKQLGMQEVNSIQVKKARVVNESSESGKSGSENRCGEKLGHTPFTVAGPRGKQRTMVKGNSIGLQFAYVETGDSDHLWDLDGIMGVLSFNTRHPQWFACERHSEKALMRLQEHIAITALHLQALSETQRTQHQNLVEEMMPSFVYLLMNGDTLAGRLPGRKKVA